MYKTAYPTAAGVLTIIAAFVSLCVGIVEIMGSVTYYSFHGASADYLWMYVGLLGIVCFAGGLKAGMFSMERRHFRFSIMGTSLTLLSGFVTMAAFDISFGLGGLLGGGLLFGLSTMVLSVLALVCVTMAKGEFS